MELFRIVSTFVHQNVVSILPIVRPDDWKSRAAQPLRKLVHRFLALARLNDFSGWFKTRASAQFDSLIQLGEFRRDERLRLVDPFLLMQAALAAASSLGVEIRGHAEVNDIRPRAEATEVLTEADTFSAHCVVDCRGAWSGAPIRPRKGQMLYVQPQAAMLQHVLRAPDVYLVPRSSGKVLVGATVEDVGYDKSVDSATIHSLLSAATKYLPDLASAPITQSWAGLRPGTPDDLPILGPTGTPGVFIASGHFRNGILLAPITAKIMADLVEGRPSPLDIGAFAPFRFHSSLK